MKKLEQYRKFIVALVAANGAAIGLVAKADFSTWQGIVTFVLAELASFGVYAIPNAQGPAKGA